VSEGVEGLEGVVPDGALVARRLAELRDRVRAAGGEPDAIEVVGVTKGFPPPIVDVALEAGLTLLGENYAQELLDKVDQHGGEQAPGRPGCASTAGAGAARAPEVHWQFIGALQRNKVRLLAPYVQRWQSIDRPELVDELAKRAPSSRLLVQVNTTGEGQKSGCAPADVGALVERASVAGLVVEGLMTVGPTDPAVSPAAAFRLLRRFVDRYGLRWCSMGMSDDLEIAVREGTNMIRVGRALFGPRARRANVGN
jgi:uncharacterized pyridoxal phosphate-containing UPF0001 family protein